MFVALLLLLTNVSAALAGVTVTPVTWNVIGLDSNNVNVGPNTFPVGARICTDGNLPSGTVRAKMGWDDPNDAYTGNAYINSTVGTLTEGHLD